MCRFLDCAGGIKSKFDYIVHFVQQNKPSVFFLSESELTQNDLDIVKIHDYDLLTAASLPTKSRLSCYIHNSIKYKQLVVQDNLDIIALDIGSYRIIGVYKGCWLPVGQTKVSQFKSLISFLTKLTKVDKSIIVGGDFNVDVNKNHPI